MRLINWFAVTAAFMLGCMVGECCIEFREIYPSELANKAYRDYDAVYVELLLFTHDGKGIETFAAGDKTLVCDYLRPHVLKGFEEKWRQFK